MTAGIFAALGVWTGTTVAGSSENPKGFFEHVVIREQVTKGILASHHFDPLGVRALPPATFNPNVKFNHTFSLRQAIDSIIAQDGYTGNTPWLYKGAKMTLIWRMYDQAFPNAVWVVVTRSREGFVNSCLKTSFMKQHSSDRTFWYQLADQYEARLRDLKASVGAHFTIETDALINNDFKQIQMICNHLKIPYEDEKVSDFVAPALWHN